MAYKEPNVLRDGWVNTLGGVDSGRATNLLQKNQLAFAINASLRGGYAECRPPFVQPTLTFPTDEVRDWWGENEAQGGFYIQLLDQSAMVIAMVGGRLFRIGVDNFVVDEITPTLQTTSSTSFISPPEGTTVTVTVSSSDKIRVNLPVVIGDGNYMVTAKANNVLTLRNDTATAGESIANPSPVTFLDPNPKNIGKTWMEQADKYLIIQDGKSAAIIYDGVSTKRATVDQVPTGTAMVFNEEIGRLCVALPNNEVAIGDILDPIKFTETGYLNEGGKFKIPRKFGKVSGACMLANQDRSNGQGAMLFFTPKGITAFNLPPNRDTWKSLNYPVQINMPIRGAKSSVTNVNGDVFYRATDGLRSFALTRQEFGSWGNTPVSRELGRVLDRDDQKLLQFGSAVLFDNRLLFTVAPHPTRYAAYHNGLGVLDFDVLSGMRDKQPPVYDGVWTGLKITHLVASDFGDERCFAFTRNDAGGTGVWEVLRRGDFDGDDGRIEWSVESRALDFGNPMELKRLDSFEMWVDRVFGEVNFTLSYRPDQYPCWLDWDNRQVCQKQKDCSESMDGCTPVSTFRPGYRCRQAFGQPPDTDESIDNKPARNGYMFELRVACTGRARIKWGMAKAARQAESATPEIQETETS